MRTRSGYLAIAIVILTLMAAALACGADEPETAREILDASEDAWDAVETGSFAWESTLTLTEPQTYELIMVISGDFQVPDRSRITSIASASDGFSYELDSIIIGEDSYHEDPITGEWVAAPNIGSGPGNSGNPSQWTPELSDEAIDLVDLVGVEELDGMQVYYLQGQIPPGLFKEAVEDPSLFENGDISHIEIAWWIGVEDYLVRRARYNFQVTDTLSGQAAKAMTTITYSDYGKEVDIQPPEVVATSPPTTMPRPAPTPTNTQQP